MLLTGKQARDIVYEENEDWEEVFGTQKTTGHSRWAVNYTGIFRHIPTNKHYRFNWRKGATEYQDEKPFEYDKEVEVEEVELKEVMVKKWVKV